MLEAEKAFQRVLELNPAHPAALNGLGQLYLAQRKYDVAEPYLLKAAPQAPAAWWGLTKVYLLQGRFGEAEPWAQKIVDSGQAGDDARRLLQAAKEKHLSDDLRAVIEPPPVRPPEGSPLQSGASMTAGGADAAKPKLIPAAPANLLQSPRAAAMRTIVLAGLEYATEHPQWPTTLDELKPGYLDAGKIDFGPFVYHPPGPESREKNPQEVAVLSEKAPAFAGGQLVGFADGYVEFVRDAERLKQLFPAEVESPPVTNEETK